MTRSTLSAFDTIDATKLTLKVHLTEEDWPIIGGLNSCKVGENNPIEGNLDDTMPHGYIHNNVTHKWTWMMDHCKQLGRPPANEFYRSKAEDAYLKQVK